MNIDRSLRIAFFCLAIALPCFAHAQSSPPAEIQESEVERTLFDLYVGSTFRGGILAKFGEGWFQIENPLDLAEQLTDIKDGTAFASRFAGRIEGKRDIPEVGSVEADFNSFRIIVRPSPELLRAKALEIEQRVPDPERRFSVQQRLGVNSVRDYEGTSASAFSHQTWASFGRYWGKFDGTFIEEESYELSELTANGIVGDYQTGLGLFRTDGQIFGQSVEIAGFQFRSSEEIFQDSSSLRGSRIEIFVPSRGRVQFFRGARLLGVQFLEFGLQEIDTSSFPQGSYDVDIVITTDSGQVIREQRFFTKSGLLAIRSRPLYTLQLGSRRDEFNLLDVPIYQAGARYRLNDFMDVGGSVYGTDEESIGSVELTAVWRDFIFNGGVSRSDDQDTGVRANINGELAGLQWSLSGSKTFSDSIVAPIVTPEPFPGIIPTPRPQEESINLLKGERSTVNASIYRLLDNVTFRVSGSYNDSRGYERRYAYGPGFEWRILSDSTRALALNTSFFRTEEGERAEISLAFRLRFNDWFLDSRASGREGGGQKERLLTTYATYDQRSTSERGLRLALGNEVASRSERGGGDSIVNSAAVDFANSVFETNSFVRNRTYGDNEGTAVGVNARSAFNFAGGSLTVSRPSNNEALLLARVKSNSTKSKFEILINDRVYDTIEAGTSAVIGLRPYRTYTLGVRPAAGADILKYDTDQERVTVFPGNVIRRTWEAQKVFIALGRLLDRDGNPISWQRIRGVSGYVYTEEDGSFQAEISGSEELHLRSAEHQCSISLPDIPHGEYFTDYGDVYCR